MLHLSHQTLSQGFNIGSVMRGGGNKTARLLAYLHERTADNCKDCKTPLIALIGVQQRAALITLQLKMEVEIGRGVNYGMNASKSRFELPNPFLSARHALLGADECGTYLMDVGSNGGGSKNGTFLNGERLAANQQIYLHVGDRVSFGSPGCDTAEEMVILQPLA